MKNTILFIFVLLFSGIVFGQSNDIVPIILDGKPAYLNTITGKLVSKKEALTKKYKKINLNNFSSTNTAILPSLKNEHIVNSGETLHSISRMYSIPVLKLKELNQLDSNILSIGQELIVQ